MKNLKIIIVLFAFALCAVTAQTLTTRYNQLGKMYLLSLSSAPFPDSAREEGHTYNNQTYSKQDHYNDSSVAVFIPKNFRKTGKVAIVVYFHGWYNNIDSACVQYKLVEQFTAAQKNAIFVFPEGPKNAPDSYGGKLEQNDGLKNLLSDVTAFLVKQKEIKSRKIGKIILAGHSGAYRVIAYSLMRGGVTKNVSDVLLFDALYAEMEKFGYWIEKYNGRFLTIYTDNGGTKQNCENFMDDLKGWGIPFFKTEELDLHQNDLLRNKLIFIHTGLTHNEVISTHNQFEEYLRTSKMGK